MSKIRVAIDINEILRARWVQFDKYYVEEFGEEGVPLEEQYVYDFFNTYKWKNSIETVREMREPEDIPDSINPIDYQINEKTGEAPADFMIFKKPEEIKLSAKEVYNRFMYEDYLFEIHGSAPMMYKNMDVHINKFLDKYENTADFTVFSVENKFSIPPTLFFLSKTNSRFKKYQFINNGVDIWKDTDVLITTDPIILKLGTPWGKKLIKIKRPYNETINTGNIEVIQIAELINNPKFEKIIKYKNK